MVVSVGGEGSPVFSPVGYNSPVPFPYFTLRCVRLPVFLPFCLLLVSPAVSTRCARRSSRSNFHPCVHHRERTVVDALVDGEMLSNQVVRARSRAHRLDSCPPHSFRRSTLATGSPVVEVDDRRRRSCPGWIDGQPPGARVTRAEIRCYRYRCHHDPYLVHGCLRSCWLLFVFVRSLLVFPYAQCVVRPGIGRLLPVALLCLSLVTA